MTAEPARRPHAILRRRAAETAILTVAVLLVVRAVAVEPFGVPTGSMAPGLRGNHWCGNCSRCGAPVVVGGNGLAADPALAAKAAAAAHCPNCGKGPLPLDQLAESAGDRLLVDKTAFSYRPPRRWEMAVFRCPVDFSKPYVKRVAGLPGESILVRGGDLFIDGELARKSLGEVRALAIAVFDQRYLPPETGWRPRWVWDQAGPPPTGEGAMLSLDGLGQSDAFSWLAYRNWLLDQQIEEPITDFFTYNGGGEKTLGSARPNHAHDVLHLVHDFLIECEVRVTDGSGTFAFALADGHDEAVLELPVGEAGGDCRLVIGGASPRSRAGLRLAVGNRYKLTFAFIDRRVQATLDDRVLFPPFDLPPEERRAGVSRPVKIGVRGIRAEVSDFRLSRDVLYIAAGRHGVAAPYRLGPDEYFMLGDNSANSEDSRRWAVPVVPHRWLLGKPVFRHQPAKWSVWQIGGRAIEFSGIDWDRFGRLR